MRVLQIGEGRLRGRKKPIAQLSPLALHCSYLETLLSVIEDAFEEIPKLLETMPPHMAAGYAWSKAMLGLNIA
jgi:hypothetical protein